MGTGAAGRRPLTKRQHGAATGDAFRPVKRVSKLGLMIIVLDTTSHLHLHLQLTLLFLLLFLLLLTSRALENGGRPCPLMSYLGR